jgi:hypothetical protein
MSLKPRLRSLKSLHNLPLGLTASEMAAEEIDRPIEPAASDEERPLKDNGELTKPERFALSRVRDRTPSPPNPLCSGFRLASRQGRGQANRDVLEVGETTTDQQ